MAAPSKRRTRVLKILAVTVSTLLALGVAEVTLQVINVFAPSFFLREEQSNQYLMDSRYWQSWHYPNSVTHHKKKCFDVQYSTNSFGMRDAEIDTTKKGVVVLGDSFVEGFGLDDHQTLTHYLDSINPAYDFLNFGISNGSGTFSELALHDNLARFVKHELVVVFFLPYNDLHDNYLSWKRTQCEYRKFPTLEKSLSYLYGRKRKPPHVNNGNGLLTVRVIEKALGKLKVQLEALLNFRFDFKSIDIKNIFIDAPKCEPGQGLRSCGKLLSRHQNNC